MSICTLSTSIGTLPRFQLPGVFQSLLTTPVQKFSAASALTMLRRKVALPSKMKRTGCSLRIGTMKGCSDGRADQAAAVVAIWANTSFCSTCSNYCPWTSESGWTKSIDRQFSQEKEDVMLRINRLLPLDWDSMSFAFEKLFRQGAIGELCRLTEGKDWPA